MVRPMLDAIAQHVDCPSPRDLPLQPRQEFAASRAVLGQVQQFGGDGLSRVEEGGDLGEIEAVLSVIVLRVSAYPAGAVGGRPARALCLPATDRRGLQ